MPRFGGYHYAMDTGSEAGMTGFVVLIALSLGQPKKATRALTPKKLRSLESPGERNNEK